MNLIGRSLDLEDPSSVDCQRQDSGPSISTGTHAPELVPPLCDEEAGPPAIPPSQITTVVKKKGTRKKRKTAEEKAADVRAWNRRAQQAFRKRQKVLSQQRTESMVNLVKEIETLRETNKVLQDTINRLMLELGQRSNSSSSTPLLIMDPMPADCNLQIPNMSIFPVADLTHILDEPLSELDAFMDMPPSMDFGHLTSSGP